jgi:hypothetical protein
MPPQARASAAAAQGYSFATSGNALAVLRAAQPLTYADGLPAKRAAMAHCAQQGRALNPAAFGRFHGGAWQFAGGCV